MKILEKLINPEIERVLALVINRGYFNATKLIKNTDFLSWVIGEEKIRDRAIEAAGPKRGIKGRKKIISGFCATGSRSKSILTPVYEPQPQYYPSIFL